MAPLLVKLVGALYKDLAPHEGVLPIDRIAFAREDYAPAAATTTTM